MRSYHLTICRPASPQRTVILRCPSCPPLKRQNRRFVLSIRTSSTSRFCKPPPPVLRHASAPHPIPSNTARPHRPAPCCRPSQKAYRYRPQSRADRRVTAASSIPPDRIREDMATSGSISEHPSAHFPSPPISPAQPGLRRLKAFALSVLILLCFLLDHSHLRNHPQHRPDRPDPPPTTSAAPAATLLASPLHRRAAVSRTGAHTD